MENNLIKASECHIKITELIDDTISKINDEKKNSKSVEAQNIFLFAMIFFTGSFFICLFLLLAYSPLTKLIIPAFEYIILITLILICTFVFLSVKNELKTSKENGYTFSPTKNRLITSALLFKETKKTLLEISKQNREEFILSIDYWLKLEGIFSKFCLTLLPTTSTSIFFLEYFGETFLSTFILNLKDSGIFSGLMLFASILFLLGLFIQFYLSPKWNKYKLFVQNSLIQNG